MASLYARPHDRSQEKQNLSFGLWERSKAHVVNKAGIVLFLSKEEGGSFIVWAII